MHANVPLEYGGVLIRERTAMYMVLSNRRCYYTSASRQKINENLPNFSVHSLATRPLRLLDVR